MKLRDYFDGSLSQIPDEIARIEVARITADPRKIDEKTLFFFLPSVSRDNTGDLAAALARRPRALAWEAGTPRPTCDLPILEVANVRAAYARAMAKECRVDFTRMRFHAVTGTNGKTTTSRMLAHILRSDGRKVGWIGTGAIVCDGKKQTDRYYSMTTPDPDLLYPSLAAMQREGVSDVVMEVSSHALGLGKVAPIPYETAIFTNLSSEHLDFHGDIEHYYAAKKSLFRQAKIAVIGADDPYGRRLADERKKEFPDRRTLTFGAIFPADMRMTNIPSDGDGPAKNAFLFDFCGHFLPVDCRMSGAYNLYNAAAALGAAILSGVDPVHAATALSAFSGVVGRYERFRDGVEVIIDYAHTPYALESLLKSIKFELKPKQKLYLVFGCGGNRDRSKRPETARIAERYADFSYLTNDNPRKESPQAIFDDIRRGFSSPEKYRVIENRCTAIEAAILGAADGDVVAVIGKGAEKYMIDAGGVRDFDERKTILEALKKRKSGNTEKVSPIGEERAGKKTWISEE